jgi:hypothetical protein
MPTTGTSTNDFFQGKPQIPARTGGFILEGAKDSR